MNKTDTAHDTMGRRGGNTKALELSCRIAEAKSSVGGGAVTTELGGCWQLFH